MQPKYRLIERGHTLKWKFVRKNASLWKGHALDLRRAHTYITPELSYMDTQIYGVWLILNNYTLSKYLLCKVFVIGCKLYICINLIVVISYVNMYKYVATWCFCAFCYNQNLT